MRVLGLVAQSCPTLWNLMDCSPPGSSVHGEYSGKNTGVGCHTLLPGGLPRCKQILYSLSHHGSPRILEWGACPFSRGSSQPRNQTRVSCIAGGFFLPVELPGKPNERTTFYHVSLCCSAWYKMAQYCCCLSCMCHSHCRCSNSSPQSSWACLYHSWN